MRMTVDKVDFHFDEAEDAGVPDNAYIPIAIFNAWVFERGYWKAPEKFVNDSYLKWQTGKGSLYDFLDITSDFRLFVEDFKREVRLFAFQYGSDIEFYDDITEFFEGETEYHVPVGYSDIEPFFHVIDKKFKEFQKIS